MKKDFWAFVWSLLHHSWETETELPWVWGQPGLQSERLLLLNINNKANYYCFQRTDLLLFFFSGIMWIVLFKNYLFYVCLCFAWIYSYTS